MATELRSSWRSLLERAETPTDGAPLVFFRLTFGLLLFVATVRFAGHGWISEHYLVPRHFFPFWGLSFVRPLPGAAMYAVFAIMGLSALGVALGAYYRASIVALGVSFTYVHAIDKTYYLNHYYLITLLCVIMALLPLSASTSVDAWRGRTRAERTFPSWMLWIVRFQVGVVYFFGGVAKLEPDWLFHAQPLTIWLARNRDVFLIGHLFAHKATAFAMSWAGLLFDLSTPFTLSFRRTRTFAYVAVVGFHLVTMRLFQLGMFPVFMIGFALVFFPATTFRKLVERVDRAGARAFGSRRADSHFPKSLGVPRWTVVFVLFQVLFPLRAWLYPGRSIWSEEGFRFSWKVMLTEKNGYLEVRARDKATGQVMEVSPSALLTPQQVRQMAVQPDMILAFAHMVHDEFARQGKDVAVFVTSDVSLNARPNAPLVDGSVDLALEEDTLAPKRWIVPLPEGLTPRF